MERSSSSFAAVKTTTAAAAAAAGCPFLHPSAAQPLNYRAVGGAKQDRVTTSADLDLHLVQQDIKNILTKSQSFWPADFGNYGPLLIRQAWHCAGSYRASDGHGGCDGGRQRFDPERSWDDNVNLDKSKQLLWPIKQKYGKSLSWGDLLILAGNAAIESMGGPVLGFCGGRTDDDDGRDSLELGPSPQQNQVAPCEVNGKCDFPLGATTLGLIYVNPEGPMGVPDPVKSAGEIRDVFSRRMGFSDVETVALIAGGHTFGKAHGACPAGPGPSPLESPRHPWPGGLCPHNGVVTSGFEGQWTDNPTEWSSDFLTNLLQFTWKPIQGSGHKTQWANDKQPTLMMLTSDVALIHDSKYAALVKRFAENATDFRTQFAKAWYQLTTRDMGPPTRCLGNLVAPPQHFQFPLPAPPKKQSAEAWQHVRAEVHKVMVMPQPSVLPTDSSSYASLFVQLAWSCAATFRSTDYQGGCNGARIRLAPQANWKVNQDMENVLKLLQPVKQQFESTVSWADLIVLAAQVALEQGAAAATVDDSSSSFRLSFCPGRSDAVTGDTGSRFLSPPLNYSVSSVNEWQQRAAIMGLTPRQWVALNGRLRSPGQLGRLGYMSQTYTSRPNELSNAYFVALANHDWQPFKVPNTGVLQFQSTSDPSLYLTPSDLVLLDDPALFSIVQEYAADAMVFRADFAAAWTQLMNADRFNGPTANVCDDPANTIAF